jgi:hypothetical protein
VYTCINSTHKCFYKIKSFRRSHVIYTSFHLVRQAAAYKLMWCKVVPVHAMKSYGGVEVYLHSFLSLTLYGDKTVSFNTPTGLTWGKRLCRRLYLPPFWTLWGRGGKPLASAGNRIRVPPKSNRYLVILLITIIQVQYQIRIMLPSSSRTNLHFLDVNKQHFPIWLERLHHQYASTKTYKISLICCRQETKR